MKTLLCVLLLFYLRSNQWTKHRHSCIQNYIIHSWFVVQTRVCICGIIAHVMCDVILIKGVVRRSSASASVRTCVWYSACVCVLSPTVLLYCGEYLQDRTFILEKGWSFGLCVLHLVIVVSSVVCFGVYTCTLA